MIGRNTVAAIAPAVTLQWANGRQEARTTTSVRHQSYIGFHIEQKKYLELDAVLTTAKMPRIVMRHPRQGAPAEEVSHWDLGESVRLFPITSGPIASTAAASLRSRETRRDTIAAGIGLRWPDGGKSQIAIRAIVFVAAGGGWVRIPGICQFSVHSKMTDVLLDALCVHSTACEVVDAIIDRTKHPEAVSCAELALPLRGGKDEPWGKGATTVVVPFVAGHPSPITRDYLAELWRSEELWAEMQAIWPGVQSWAADYAARTPQPREREEEGDTL